LLAAQDATVAWPDGIPFSPNGRAWLFPERAVLVTRTAGPAVSADDANALIDLFLWLSAREQARAPTIVHDWRTLKSLSREARAVFMARRAELTTRPSKLYVAVQLNPVYRMALQTAMLGAQMLTQAVPTELVSEPFAVLARLGVGSPDPALHLRLREDWRTSRSDAPR